MKKLVFLLMSLVVLTSCAMFSKNPCGKNGQLDWEGGSCVERTEDWEGSQQPDSSVYQVQYSD